MGGMNAWSACALWSVLECGLCLVCEKHISMAKAWTWWSICILTLIESEILHHSIQVAPSSAVASKDLEVKITSNHNVYKFTIPGSQESGKYTAACQLGLSYTENLSTETNSQFVQDPFLKHGPRPDKIPWGCFPHGCMNKCDLWSVLMSRPSPGHSQLTNMELVRYRPRCVYIYIYIHVKGWSFLIE